MVECNSSQCCFRALTQFVHINESSPATKTTLVDETTSSSSIHRQVSEYYGKTLTTSQDLKTNACCTAGAPPSYIKKALSKIHPTVISKYYGCGLCLPQYDLTGCSILDLGCGAGRDVYVASQLVGAEGRVVGVDMTMEQLEVAREYQEFHANEFGYGNVELYHGYLERLNEIKELEPNSFDVIVSNCVINLCEDKESVLRHCLSLLKPGGELYFSDVYASRRVPQVLRDDPVLWGECLSGALYWNDFQSMARHVGFPDPRLVEDAPITIQSSQVQQVMENVGSKGLEFYSATYRLWNMPKLEPFCEDFGQAVVYKGTIPRYASGWLLDKHHYFETGRIMPVCGNTFIMLKESLLEKHFDFIGNFETHYGIFEGCGTTMPFNAAAGTSTSNSKGGGCC